MRHIRGALRTMRRLVTLAAAATLTAGLAFAGAASASAAPRTFVGPECSPSTVSYVLAALARNGTVPPPGTQVQYVELGSIVVAGNTYPALVPCVVTVP